MFPDAEPLPPSPVLYRFELAYVKAPTLRIEGPRGPVSFTVKDVSITDAIRVTEIHVDATSGSFTVHGAEYEAPRTYAIARSATVYAAPEVEGVSWVEEAWTCSHTLGLVIEARGRGVVAFRAQWTDGFEAILPPNDRHFWTAMMGGELDPAELRAFLGHPNCVGNLIPDRMIGRKDVRLFARYADGSEREVVLPRAQPETQAQPQVEPQRQPQPWKLAVATAVSIAALISVSTLVVARRRRKNGMIVP